MAEEHQGGNVNVDTTDRGCFDFLKKNKEDQKKDHQEAEVVVAEFQQKVEVSKEEIKAEDEKIEGGLLHKLHRTHSSSSSSSDEEDGDDEERKRKKKEKKEKKGLKEKIKEKLPGHKDEKDTNVPIEHVYVEEVPPSHPPPPPPYQEAEASEAEKKGLLEKIKDKLPGQHKKPEGDHEMAPYAPGPGPAQAPAPPAEGDGEKKGFLDKIKEKIPGFHPKPAEEEKEVEKRECTVPTSST